MLDDKYVEIETYMNEMVDKFIMGVESLDKFDDYVAQVERMGLADVLAVYQAAYDRYTHHAVMSVGNVVESVRASDSVAVQPFRSVTVTE